MEKLVHNEFNLNINEIDEVVKRVKILLVNSKNEVMLGYSYNTYQFPGGHVEENEDLNLAILREVKEETGIELENKEYKPFALFEGYYKDWPSVGVNRKIEIYYYEIKTDKKPNLNNTNYTENELKGDFELRYIPISKVEETLKENSRIYGDDKGIAKEMINLFSIYKKGLLR